MHLAKLYKRFDSRCKSYDARIRDILAIKGRVPLWQFNYLTEVLISDIWQSWCLFCREMVLSSCRGTVARDNSIIASRRGDNSWKRIGYEAAQHCNNQPIKPNGHLNFLLRKEPTWGSLDSFLKIIVGLNPANATTLLSTYGSFTSINDLQLARNSCAHKNVETIKGLQPLSKNYKFSSLGCATDLVWKTNNYGAELAIELWLYEMNLIADYVTSHN